MWGIHRRDVLDIDELELYDYERVGLVGANGAGGQRYLPHSPALDEYGEEVYILIIRILVKYSIIRIVISII